MSNSYENLDDRVYLQDLIRFSCFIHIQQIVDDGAGRCATTTDTRIINRRCQWLVRITSPFFGPKKYRIWLNVACEDYYY